MLEAGAGSIAYRFQARDLNLVLRCAAARGPLHPALRRRAARRRRAASTSMQSGKDTLSEPRMYQLVRQSGAAPRTFEITFLEPGARAYVFTFG